MRRELRTPCDGYRSARRSRAEQGTTTRQLFVTVEVALYVVQREFHNGHDGVRDSKVVVHASVTSELPLDPARLIHRWQFFHAHTRRNTF
jgi:hypothetical protein